MDKEIENINGQINPKGLEAEKLNVESIGVGLPPEVPSHEENKEKLANILHKDTLGLPHLRTYHGDIAEFIKSKDKSLSDVVLAEQQKKRAKEMHEREIEQTVISKEAKEEITIREEAEEKREPVESTAAAINRGFKKDLEEKEKKQETFSELPKNFLMYVVSLLLIIGAVTTVAYLFVFNERIEPIVVTKGKTILAANRNVVLESSALSPASLAETMNSLRSLADNRNGVTAIVFSDAGKKTVINSPELADKLNLNMPSALKRSLQDDFMLGLYNTDFFLLLKVKDYGIAYRDMLAWEATMPNDLKLFLKNAPASTTPAFKDLIVRNKDTRAVTNVIYTFLDKETVLITESEDAIKGLLDAYVAHSTVR